MKILHINYSDQVGGAAISVMRLHKSLIKKKIKSKMLVQEKNNKHSWCDFSKINFFSYNRFN